MAPVASPTGDLSPLLVAPLGRGLGVSLVGLLLLGQLLRRLPIGVRLLGIRLLLPVGVARRGGVPLLLGAVLLPPASSALLLLLLRVARLLLVVALLLLELLLLVVALLLLEMLLLVVALLLLRVALLRVALLLAIHPLLPHVLVCLGIATPPMLARLLRLVGRLHGLVRLPIRRIPPGRRAALGDYRRGLLDVGQGLELHILKALLRRVLHKA